MPTHCHIEGDEESVKAYAMIDASNEAWVRLYVKHVELPKEKIMSLETVKEQQGKVNALLTKMRMREATMTRELADG